MNLPQAIRMEPYLTNNDCSMPEAGSPPPQNDMNTSSANLPFASSLAADHAHDHVDNTDELGSTASRSFGVEGDGDDDNVDLAPAFTTQDENREMTSLTVHDIVSSQSDLRGNFPGPSGTMQESEMSLSNRDVTHLLSPLRRALSLLPASKTHAYHRAEVACPEQVSPERKAIFLEREDSNIDHASRRLARYWEYRSSLFGDLCYQPMTLSGAMKEETSNLATRKVFQLMPVKDTSERAIIFISPGRRNFAEYSVRQEAQALWYLLEVCMEDPAVRKAGVVIVVDGRDLQKKHYSRKMKLLVEIMGSVMPVRVRGIHLCYPSKVAYFVMYPVLKQILGRHFRLRFKMHFGTQEKVLRDLANGYCLPVDRLPVELGGTITLSMDQFLANRIALESSSDLGRLSQEAPSTRKSKRTHKTKPKGAKETPPPQKPSLNSKRKVPSPKLDGKSSTSHRGGKAKESKSKTPFKGRRPDPRMARAAQAKMDDPSLTLLDALVVGGYVFNGKKVDRDGISLRQRTNNLCRRIRLEKERIAQEEHEHANQRKKKKKTRKSLEIDEEEEELDIDEQHSSGRTTTTVGDNADQSAPAYGQEMQDSVLQEVKPAAVLSSEDLANISAPMEISTSAAIVSHAHNEILGANGTLETLPSSRFGDGDAKMAAATNSTASAAANGAKERRDSFLEEIEKLPGIDDLDPFDIMAEDEEIEDLTKLSSMLISE